MKISGSKLFVKISFLVTLSISSSSGIFCQVNESDSTALVDFYNALNGENWDTNSNWLEGPVSTWEWITVYNNRVTSICMPSNNLEGTLPVSFWSMDSLKQVCLTRDRFEYEIPSSISDLKLTRLGLPFLSSGVIPEEIYDVTTLEHLQLQVSTEDSLVISPKIEQLKELRFLWLFGFHSFPEELNTLTKMRSMTLSGSGTFNTDELDEAFTDMGTFPNLDNLLELSLLQVTSYVMNNNFIEQVANLPVLENLWINSIFIREGFDIPIALGQSSSIQDLRLNSINLNPQPFPEFLFDNPSLQELSFSLFGDFKQFALSGAIPEAINDASALEFLNIDSHNFDELPEIINPNISEFIATNNRFDFEDIELNLSVTGFEFNPQQPFGEEQYYVEAVGTNFEKTFNLGGSNNSYEWRKEGDELIIDETVITFEGGISIAPVTLDDAGVYSLYVTSSEVPDMTLESSKSYLTASAISAYQTQIFDEDSILEFELGLDSLISFPENYLLTSRFNSTNEQVSVTGFGNSITTSWEKDFTGSSKISLEFETIGGLVTDTVEVIVLPINDLPEITLPQDTTLTALQNHQIPFSFLDVDNEFDQLSFELQVENETLFETTNLTVNSEGTGSIDLTPISGGSTQLTIQITDEEGQASVSMDLIIEVLLTTPVNEQSFRVFPNPVNKKLFFDHIINKPLTVQIMDLSGKTLSTHDFKKDGKKGIDITGLQNGHYLLIIENEDNTVEHVRFIKY